MQIFANGKGGKHRNTPGAKAWRGATAAMATAIQAEYPEMNRVIALCHAEDETAAYLSAAARLVRA